MRKAAHNSMLLMYHTADTCILIAHTVSHLKHKAAFYIIIQAFAIGTPEALTVNTVSINLNPGTFSAFKLQKQAVILL